MKFRNFRNYKNINTSSSYLTYDETQAIKKAKKIFRSQDYSRIESTSVLYGYNIGYLGDESYIHLFEHYLDVLYIDGFTIVMGYFGGIRDIIKGEWSPDEISRRNTGKTVEELRECFYKHLT